MSLSQKERSHKLYVTRKESGLCPRCGEVLDRDGMYCKSCCEKIALYNRESRKFFRDHNICTECRKVYVPGTERICPECLAKNMLRIKISEEQKTKYNERHKKHSKELYRQRSESGICTRCGRRKAECGKKKCGICLAKDAQIHRQISYKDGIGVREMRRRNGLCYYCGGEIEDKTYKSCISCRNKFKKCAEKSKGKNKIWAADNKIVFKRY